MNREIVQSGAGAGIYPISGDVISTAGSPKVTVVGIQGISVLSKVLFGGEILQYNGILNQWVPTLIASLNTHAEPLTDGNANFIFAATLTSGGDIVMATGVPDL